jgi:hypothetical protein
MNSTGRWKMRVVAEAIGMKDRALRQCFEIGALTPHGRDKKSSGSGTCVALSRPRAYQAAIMNELNKNGLAMKLAARLASEFSDVGNKNRAPGEVFPRGATILCAAPDGATVRNVFADTSIADVLQTASVIIVNCNHIVQQVDAGLLNQKEF